MLATTTRIAQELVPHLKNTFGRDPVEEQEQERMYREMRFGASAASAASRGLTLSDQTERFTKIVQGAEALAAVVEADSRAARENNPNTKPTSELFAGYKTPPSTEHLENAAAQSREGDGQEFENAASINLSKSHFVSGAHGGATDPKGEIYFFKTDLDATVDDIMGRLLRGERLTAIDAKVLDEVRRAKAATDRAEASLNEVSTNYAFVA